MKAYGLTTEHLINPTGIDSLCPRLSWKCTDGNNQTAYQIQAAYSEAELRKGKLLWDSGIVESDESLNISYQGELHTRAFVVWRVRLKDETNSFGDWSETACFEMGLPKEEDKLAKWINPEKEYNIDSEPPVSLLRKEFEIEEGFLKARLYISALGMYEAKINDSRVGDQVLTPGFTDMERRRQYQTYDVTHLLTAGKNAIGVSLADGWARGRLGFSGKRNQFSTEIALWALLILTYPDGEKTVFVTDQSWKTTKNGPCRLSDLRDGEIYDARMEIDGWSSAGFDDSTWEPVHLKDYSGIIEGTKGLPVREVRRLKGKLLDTPDGRTVIDFGENIAGYVEFCVSGKAGDEVKLVHGEVLDKAGNFTMRNFHFEGTPEMPIYCTKQEIKYILSGKEKETYKPSFTFMGFRYVLVEKWPGNVNPDDFTAVVICSDMKKTVDFKCSNELLNQFFENSIRSQMGNFIDIPTDCPHRERMGWTGDAQIFCRTAATNFDTQAFFIKWLRDVSTAQKKDGEIPNTVPFESMPTEEKPIGPVCSSGWGDAVTIIPYKLYEVYGDKQIISDIYPAMKRWVDYEMHSAASQIKDTNNPDSAYIWDSGFHWGEWLEPSDKPQDEYMKEPKDETATAYFAYSARLLSEMAGILGKSEDKQKYGALADKVKTAYIHTFTDNGSINGGNRQCLYVRPLALNLLPEDKKQEAADRLNQIVIENGYHIGTGFLSTPYLCEVLTKAGYIETAYKMLSQTTSPSWLYPVTKGATTIWESWEGYDKDGEPFASHNHYSFGSVMEWVYRYMVGIDTYIQTPGYKKIKIQPMPGGGITYAKASIDTVRGNVSCGWKKENNIFIVEFTIPANTTADIILPEFVESVSESSGLCFKKNNGCFSAIAKSGQYHIECV